MSRTLLLSSLATLALSSALASSALAADYVQAPGSTLVFANSYDGEVFTGRFGSFDTRLSFDPAKLEDAKLEVTIGMPGTSSGNSERDGTLLGGDFFNVGKFAQAKYVATRFRALGGDQYAADGELTLRGVTRPVTLTFTWTAGAQPVLKGKATVKRLDFGVGGGDWADTKTIPNETAVSTKVVLQPAS